MTPTAAPMDAARSSSVRRGGWRRVFAASASLYVGLFCALSVFCLLRWPVFAGDTDLWFHLTGGRYLFAHGAIPHDSFFSFVSPPREWLDHFWLFRAAIYQIYVRAGYGGLILLRSLAYLGTIVLVFRYLLHGQPARDVRIWLIIVGVLCGLALFPRHLLVRPHVLTYLFIILFLYILEHRPHRAWVLPGCAVLWCNLHGVYYPLMVFITMAYSLQYLVDRFRGTPYRRTDAQLFFVPTVLSMVAVLLTPYGTRLLPVPFRPMSFESQAIQELIPLSWEVLSSFQIGKAGLPGLTTFSLLLVAASLAVASSFMTRRVRISHLVLFLGGLWVLTRGVRGINEFSLLALPVLRANPLRSLLAMQAAMTRSARVVIGTVLAVIPLLTLQPFLGPRPRYPFSHRALPEGVVAFLDQLPIGGKLLNGVNTGGYLQWRLYPRFKIFMDMQVPFLFPTDDLYWAWNLFDDQQLLKKALVEYQPDFLSVPLPAGRFRDLVRQFPDYVVVFFDDAEALYVNRHLHPDIAAQYELQEVDPFEVVTMQEALLTNDAGDRPVVRYLRRLLDLYPDCGVTNHLVASLYNTEGGYDRALPFAEALIKNFPDSPSGYRLKGDALKGLGLFERALACYRTALTRSPAGERATIYKALGAVYAELHQYGKAYTALRKGTDSLSLQESIDALYRFAEVARLAGKPQVAEAILRYLDEYRISEEEGEWRGRVKRDLEELGVDLDE